MEQRGHNLRILAHFKSENAWKALKHSKWTNQQQLITRRSEVQVLLPQPEIRWNRLIPADYFCFLQLFREVYFGFLNLTQILTHTEIFPDWRGL